MDDHRGMASQLQELKGKKAEAGKTPKQPKKQADFATNSNTQQQDVTDPKNKTSPLTPIPEEDIDELDDIESYSQADVSGRNHGTIADFYAQPPPTQKKRKAAEPIHVGDDEDMQGSQIPASQIRPSRRTRANSQVRAP